MKLRSCFALLLAVVLTATAVAQWTNDVPAPLQFGQGVTFKVAVGSGSAPFTYQWKKNGTNVVNATGKVTGATTASLSLTAVSFADVGTYTVEVKNAAGTIVVGNGIVTVSAVLPGNATFTVTPGPVPVTPAGP